MSKHSPIKIMNKDYHFVNATGDKVTVRPLPMGSTPAGVTLYRTLNEETRQWKRKFAIVEAKHADWKDLGVVETENYRNMPVVSLNGNDWTLTPIPGIKATRKRRTKAEIEADRAKAEEEAAAEDEEDDKVQVTPVAANQSAMAAS
jgi:hypothetical protein